MRFLNTICAVALSASATNSFVLSGSRRLQPFSLSSSALMKQVTAERNAITSSNKRGPTIIRQMSSSPEEFIKSEIGENKVIVFSKSYCPFCASTKALFEDMNVDAKIYELDQMPDGNDIQGALLDCSGQRTVPNVFIDGQHVGGNDKVQAAAKSGKLQEMLGI